MAIDWNTKIIDEFRANDGNVGAERQIPVIILDPVV